MEGGGSFQINDRLQVVFELGQMHDKAAIYSIHKILNVPGKVKERKSDGYTMISTKHPRVIEEIIKMLSGKMLGMKSFELRIWKYAYNTELKEKKKKAKKILEKLRTAASQEASQEPRSREGARGRQS